MGANHRRLVGYVAEIRRHPVKSMQGETLALARAGPNGIEGDRQFAVIDVETGRVASAKSPKKWAGVLNFRANMRDGVLVVIAPDGTESRMDYDDLDTELTRWFGRPVVLRGLSPTPTSIETMWPDMPGLGNEGTQSIEGLPAGGYFDLAPVHLVTTASLRRYRELAPECDFHPRRFRPNIVIETEPELNGFVEQSWIGRHLVLGQLSLKVMAPCSRCVMTTLAQPGLAADPKVLRAAVVHGDASVGVYAETDCEGEVAAGCSVWLE